MPPNPATLRKPARATVETASMPLRLMVATPAAEKAGHVTTAVYSANLEKPIALAMLTNWRWPMLKLPPLCCSTVS